LAPFRAFTDDSAAQKGDKRLFMAGYLHRTDVWADFSQAWDAELKAWPPIKYFKGAEAHNLSGQFDHKRGWDEAIRQVKMGYLAEIIQHFKPISFQFSINRKLFEDHLKPVSPYGFGKPHFQLSNVVVGSVVRMAAQNGFTEPIEFIFDEQDGVSADVTMFFEDMMEALPSEARKLIDGTPSFKDDKDKRFMPLQAADMLAWHVRREHEVGAPVPLTRLLINKEAHLISEIPDYMVQDWAEHHGQQPGLATVKTKPQWREFKGTVQKLRAAGINPKRVRKPGIYYPDSWGVFGRFLEIVRRLIGR